MRQNDESARRKWPPKPQSNHVKKEARRNEEKEETKTGLVKRI